MVDKSEASNPGFIITENGQILPQGGLDQVDAFRLANNLSTALTPEGKPPLSAMEVQQKLAEIPGVYPGALPEKPQE